MNHTTRTMLSALCALALHSASANDQAAHPPHWSYQGATDAGHWAALDDANKSCAISREQSPIDIDVARAKKASLAPIVFMYPSGSADVINNGHTVQVNLAPGGSIKVDGQNASLLQFHFHTPSEEKFNGKNYPMVAHFVHKSADGKLSVVAVLLKEGKENAALKAVFAGLPAEGQHTALSAFDPAAVLPANRAYYRFMGSLTTPPCSDGVRWQVLKEPVEVSKDQIASFQKLYHMNARPVQPLNDRVIEVSE